MGLASKETESTEKVGVIRHCNGQHIGAVNACHNDDDDDDDSGDNDRDDGEDGDDDSNEGDSDNGNNDGEKAYFDKGKTHNGNWNEINC